MKLRRAGYIHVMRHHSRLVITLRRNHVAVTMDVHSVKRSALRALVDVLEMDFTAAGLQRVFWCEFTAVGAGFHAAARIGSCIIVSNFLTTESTSAKKAITSCSVCAICSALGVNRTTNNCKSAGMRGS